MKWQSQSSMEFQGTKWYFIWRHQSSMECSMEFHGNKWYVIWRHQSSMEFHGTPVSFVMAPSNYHGIPWISVIFCLGIAEWFFYLLFGDSRVPWHSVEYSLEDQVKRSWNDNLKAPWNSMELSDTSFGGTKIPWNSMEHSMEFHGTKWYVIWRHQSSMEFHGIFHGIPWNICVIWSGALLIPWNPMELGDFFIWQFQSSLEFHWIWLGSPARVKCHKMSMSKFHGIPWN